MKFLALILIFFVIECKAQREDYNWTLGYYVIDFNYGSPQKKDIKNPTNASNSSCISDKNGNLLYRYGGNKLRDANENLIYSNVGAVMRSPALIPFPYDDKKTLFFHSVMGKGVLCDVINNNNSSDMQTLKTFSGSTQKFIFIQHFYHL